MLLWRAAFGRVVWRAAFWHVGSAYWHIMIGGLLAVVKGGFSGICRWTRDGGIPAYAGMTGGGGGHDGMGVGCVVMGQDTMSFPRNQNATFAPFKSHTRLTNAIRTGRLSIGSACDTLRCIHRSLGLGDRGTFEKGGHTK